MIPYGGLMLRLLLLVTLLVPSLFAQTRCRVVDGEIQVRVKYANNQAAETQLRVDLTNQSGLTIAQQFTDSSGLVRFHVSSSGGYLAKVSGPGIEDTVSQAIVFDNLETTCRSMQVVYVQVKATGEPAQSAGKPANGPVTSAAELRVPQNARKAFDKGVAAWGKRDYQQAANEFEKAVAEYPEYDTAYNNLGVMYMLLNENDKAFAAFRRSVELNDKNGDADRNLARLFLRKKDYPQAEELLKKTLAVQAPDAPTLALLSIAELQDGKLDDAIRDAQKVHAMSHDGYAVVHYVAGAALEGKHEYQQASVEYSTYLRESPNGPEAAQVRSAMDRLSNSSAADPKAAPPAKAQ